MNDPIRSLIDFEKKLADYAGEDKVISSHEMKEITESDPKRVVIKSHFPSLERMLGGFEEGELIVVSGKTGGGKTAFCQTLTDHFAKQDVNSIWFSYEMLPHHFLNKFPTLPLFYMPTKLVSKTAGWLETRIWEAKIKYDIRVVFIDHLHFLVDLAMNQNASLQIGQVVRSLKLLALKHKLVFFLIAHTTKINFDKDLELGDVRDSSFIEQEADSVVYVWRKKSKDGEENRSWLKIAKNRKHGLVDKKIELQMLNNQLSEIEQYVQ